MISFFRVSPKRQGSKSPVRLQMTNDLISNPQKAIFKQSDEIDQTPVGTNGHW
jgi:hypothetical protein